MVYVLTVYGNVRVIYSNMIQRLGLNKATVDHFLLCGRALMPSVLW